MTFGRGSIVGQATTIPKFVYILQMYLGRTVIDKTGLTGNYNFALQYTPDEMASAAPAATGAEGQSASVPSASGSSLFTAIQEQLGLKLESGKGPVEVTVIDRVEKPSRN